MLNYEASVAVIGSDGGSRSAGIRTHESLRRVLGVWFGVAVAVGSMVGAGILRAPADVAAQLPHPVLFLGVWLLGGLYALLGANSMAELGTMLPSSGAQYVYARRALGPYAGLLVGWNDWISASGSVAVVALVIAETAGEVMPAVAAHRRWLALAIILLFMALLWRGASASDRTQRLTSALKGAVLLGLVIACFALGSARGSTPGDVPGGLTLIAAIVLALQGVIYAYDGWVGILYFGEEVRDPGHSIPRALFGGVLLVIALYLLVNGAMLWVLPLDELGRSTLAAADASQRIFGDHGRDVVRAIVLIALPSAVSANLLMASRVLFAMGRDGTAPRIADRVNAGGSPSVSLIASTAVAAAFLLTGTFDRVVALLSFFFIASYAVSFVSVFVLRRREPALPRPWRAWGYPWTTALSLLGSLAFLASMLIADTRNGLIALALVAASVPVYVMIKRGIGNRE